MSPRFQKEKNLFRLREIRCLHGHWHISSERTEKVGGDSNGYPRSVLVTVDEWTTEAMQLHILQFLIGLRVEPWTVPWHFPPP